MSGIETNKELKLENVITLRKKMTQREINQELTLLNEFLEENNLSRSGTMVTSTFGVEIIDNQQVLDLEILVPLKEKPKDLNNLKYSYQPNFHLQNAIFKKHNGTPQMIQNSYFEMIEFIKNNHMKQVTPAYNLSQTSNNKAIQTLIEVDIYIGVSA